PALRPQSQHGRQQLRRNRGRRRAQRGAPLDAVPLADPADRRARRPTHEAMMATVRVAAVLTAMLLGGAGPAAAQQDLRVYVPNQMGASITVLDGEGRTLETVDLRALGFSAHAMPHQVAAEADGAAWYVTLAGDGFVLKFDGANHLVAKTPVAEPGMVVLDERRDLVFVSRALGSANPPRSLAVLRASDLALLDEPDIFIPRPHALAVE